jgi:soluble lytic murein transglycosylase-like protein
MILVLGIVALIFAAYEVYVHEAGADSIPGYARAAGFSGGDLAIAIAIAFAESSGNPDAVGDLDLGRSIGLWQINLAAHPEYTEEELYDPQTNANAAFTIYRQAGNSFRPWTTFNTGAYQARLPVDFSGDGNG